MYQSNLSSIFTTISTTGTLYDIASGIAQGDQPDQRFSSQCILKRLRVKCGFNPGGGSVTLSVVRVTVYRGITGAAFAANMTGSYNPIAYSISTQLLYDKYLTVTSAGSAGFGTVLDLNLKLNHKQKFTAAAAGNQTGESIYLIIQSDHTAGTTAPTPQGVFEIYFDPT